MRSIHSAKSGLTTACLPLTVSISAVALNRGRAFQLFHQAGLGADEDVGGHRPVMLDVTADQGVEVWDPVDVLEFVERDERAIAATFLETKRQIEESVKGGHRIGLRVEPQLGADSARRSA